jgi:hypothetical protein
MSHEQFSSLIDSLNQCAIDCIHCADACLDEENVKGLARCIRLDNDCADTCIFTAKMLARDSEFSSEILNFCAMVCDACGDECEKHAGHMEHCRVCAESCRQCAEECRSFAKVNA